MNNISMQTLERLIQYRRILLSIQRNGTTSLFSHNLASAADVNPAQVRRDLMGIGYSGSAAHGYDIPSLLDSIGELIDAPQKEHIAIAGLGHLGRAILDYFRGQRRKLEIAAAFDHDPQKCGRVFHGVRCYHTDEIENVCRKLSVTVTILTVPPAAAQQLAGQLAAAGVRGIVNYTPVKLDVPPDIYVENRDMIMAVEKAAYYARQNRERKTVHEGIS